jgi:hypothetical protein
LFYTSPYPASHPPLKNFLCVEFFSSLFP